MTISFFLIGFICLLPALGVILNPIAKKRSAYTNTFLILISTILVFTSALTNNTNETTTLTYPWFSSSGFSITVDFLINKQTWLLLCLVSSISLLVHIFSLGYMQNEKEQSRYYSTLGFFTSAMLALVSAGNLFTLFISWELIGLASYLLIGYSRVKINSGAAALQAFLVNRVSDLVLLSAIIFCFAYSNNLSLEEMYVSGSKFSLWLSFLFIFGVLAKSAQFPLFNWLPSAMAGPTPVSALLHAATLVVAGVFLLIRLLPMFPESVNVLLATVGGLTAILGALSAWQQYDLKKILAFSTISQMGVMISSLSTGESAAALVHLASHAYFKAGLFLAVGSIAYYLHNQTGKGNFNVQDIRQLGGLRKVLPITFASMFICSCALAGLPFTSGFLSKEYILTMALQAQTPASYMAFTCISVTSVLTVLYTARLLVYTFFGSSTTTFLPCKENKSTITLPVVILAIASLWFLLSKNPFHLSPYINVAHPLPTSVWLNIASATVLPIFALLFFYYYRKKSVLSSLNQLLNNGFYLDTLQQKIFVQPGLAMSSFLQKADRKFIDGFLHVFTYLTVLFSHIISFLDYWIVDGIVRVIYKGGYTIGGIVRVSRSGNVQQYIFWFLLTVLLFLIWVLF